MRKIGAQFAAASAFWGSVAILYVLQTWWLTVQMRGRGPGPYTPAALVYTSLMYLAWIPLTVAVWRISAGWTPTRLGWPGLIARHLGLGVLAAAVHNAVMATASVSLFNNPPEEGFRSMFTSGLRARSYTELIIYGGVVAAGQAFWLYDRWRDRDRQAATLEAQLANAQLSALQAQIHPHFLFNSLHTIASLAREGRNADVVRLIADLSDLLRQVTDQQAPMRPLGDEVALAARYLDIQQVRFGDRLRVDIAVPDALRTIAAPALTLQPLVDNAVRHGIAPCVNGGTIRIAAERAGGSIQITVTDDGVGVPRGWSADAATGTGLRNLRSRLDILYTGGAAMSAGGRDGGGFVATIVLPAPDGRS